jgi:pimeloyl-ACP methyl ester carboxylesterase
VLIDGGHTDVEVALDRDDLARAFAADQSGYSFDSWDDFAAAVREPFAAWRPALEERFRAGMTERNGRIVVRASAEAAAWAVDGMASEPTSAVQASLAASGVPILLLTAAGNDARAAATRFGEAVPQAEQVELAGGHDLFADAPEEIAAVVGDWLASDG